MHIFTGNGDVPHRELGRKFTSSLVMDASLVMHILTGNVSQWEWECGCDAAARHILYAGSMAEKCCHVTKSKNQPL